MIIGLEGTGSRHGVGRAQNSRVLNDDMMNDDMILSYSMSVMLISS